MPTVLSVNTIRRELWNLLYSQDKSIHLCGRGSRASTTSARRALGLSPVYVDSAKVNQVIAIQASDVSDIFRSHHRHRLSELMEENRPSVGPVL